MTDREDPYLSYLLRLWVMKNQHGASWCCSIENIKTGKRQGFSSIESLCAFLKEKTILLLEVERGQDD
jgi:hypothetical protein